MHDFLSFLILFAMVIFAVTQVEKSIARRTADEIERRSKLPPPPPPKPVRPPDHLTPRQVAFLFACFSFIFGGLAVADHFHLLVR